MPAALAAPSAGISAPMTTVNVAAARQCAAPVEHSTIASASVQEVVVILNEPTGASAPAAARTIVPHHRVGSAIMPPAVILAAGAGSRLRGDDEAAPPKPLTEVGGRLLIERTLRTFRAANVLDIVVVVGYEHERIVPELRRLAGRLRLNVTPVRNYQWERGNGTSVLAAAEHVGNRFFLAMSDHLFDPEFLTRLNRKDDGAALSLVVDHNWAAVPDLQEATKVRLAGGRIVEIGKELQAFDAVDTGVFLCGPRLFDALRRAQEQGDASLTGGVRLLAAEGDAQTVSSGGLFWQDVDTPEDVTLVEQRLLNWMPGERWAGQGVQIERAPFRLTVRMPR